MRSVIRTNPFTHTGAAFLVGGRACSSFTSRGAEKPPICSPHSGSSSEGSNLAPTSAESVANRAPYRGCAIQRIRSQRPLPRRDLTPLPNTIWGFPKDVAGYEYDLRRHKRRAP
jgi:hypothetical protein